MTQSAIGIFSAAGAGGAPAPTSPVLTNLRLWYDADDTSTITVSSGRASAITNKAAGYAWTLSNGNSSRQPLIVAAAQNGRQVLRLTSARNDFLNTIATTGFPMLSTTAFTSFVVAKTTSSTVGYKFVAGGDGGGTCWLFLNLSQKNYVELGSGNSALTGTNTMTNIPNIQAVNMTSSGASSLKTFTNGTQLENITGTAGSFSFTNTGQLTSIGTGFNNFSTADMDFCEVLSYNSVLSTTDYDTNIAYLTAKWGV
jgi:hypothetical protein